MLASSILPAPLEPIRLSTNPPVGERPARVVLATPDEMLRSRLQQQLGGAGYEVCVATDADGLFAAANDDPDLILLGVTFDGASGLELTGELRTAHPTRHHPIVLMGEGESDETLVAAGLLAGADDFVTSAKRSIELLARVRVQLRNKRHLDALARLRVERDHLRYEAQIDPLTGVRNRRSLELVLQKRAEALEPFGLLFVDVDHFKSINDRFGHDMGDQVLKSIAECLKRALRPGDAIGRYGGEEFVAVVSGAGPESTRLVGERLRAAICDLEGPSGGPTHVTVSIGCGAYDPRDASDTPEMALHRADSALYAAKHGGRNRVAVST